MVSLPTKSVRDAIGIDSYERGAAWAALILRLIASELAAPYNQAVRVTADFQKVETYSRTTDSGETRTFTFPAPIFQFQASLPYSRDAAMRYGGNWIGSIIQISEGVCPSTGISFPRGISEIASEPSWVNSLERYLAWCAWKIHSKLSPFGFQAQNAIQIRFLDEAAYPTLQISASLRFGLDDFYAYGSVVAAIYAGSGTTVNLGGGTPGDLDDYRPGGESGTGFNVRPARRSTSAFGDSYPAGDSSSAGDI